MRSNIKTIMKLLSVSEEMAEKIEMHMDIDFSECTQRQFNEEARLVCELLEKGEIK